MKTLLTGGAGYIGTHTAIELLQHGHDVVIFDNFSNSHIEAVRRVEAITGQHVPTIQGDVRDQYALTDALTQHGIDSVVHFAGKKAVGESVSQPIDYFDNNVNGTLENLSKPPSKPVQGWHAVDSAHVQPTQRPQVRPVCR